MPLWRPEPVMVKILQLSQLVTVFGGSGFLGRHVVRALAKRGYLVRVSCRRPDLANHLQPLGNVGQIQSVQANLRMRWSVDRAVQGASHVVNLVGIMHEGGRQRFSTVQEFGARDVAEAARAVGASLTHVSALGADENSQSLYAQTKARGEKAVQDTLSNAVIYRPSIVFGPEDGFFNRFANMARLSPVLQLIGGGETRLQPIYVGDVAEAIAHAVDGKVKGGPIYEIGGPQVLSFKQCIEEVLEVIHRKRMLLPTPWWVANLQAFVLGLLPNPLLTKDQVLLLRSDNVVSQTAMDEGRTIVAVGIAPKSTASILPSYLWRYRAAGQFTRRTEA